MWETIAQIVIPISGGISVWAYATNRMKLGFIVNLISEPFWFYTSYLNAQWGIFLLTIWYTGNLIYGLNKLKKGERK